ncbi:MAG: hypothetical protein R3F13_17080 [Prosthecobacter sp.]
MHSPLRTVSSFALLLPLLLTATLRGATDAPMFAGTTLTIHGETYTWTSPAVEDASFHTDTYTNAANQTVTVNGLKWSPGLATVNGTSGQGVVSGHLSGGVYSDNAVVTTENSGGPFVVHGVEFTSRTISWNFQVDLFNSYLESTGTEDWSGPNGSYHRTWYSYYDEEGDNWTITELAQNQSGHSSVSLFGVTFGFVESSKRGSSIAGSSYYVSEGWTDSYQSVDGSPLSLFYDEYSPANGTTKVTACLPGAGTFVSDVYAGVPDSGLSGVTWKPRSAPSFAKGQLWLDGKLLNWQSGGVSPTGVITDSYSGAGMTLTIHAAINDFFVSGDDAVVTITSGEDGSGAVSPAGVFSMAGHTLQNAAPNRSEPLFTGTSTVLKISLSSYAFAGGYEDSLGNRTDVYVNSSLGTIALSGTTSDPSHGTVMVSNNGFVYSGTFSNSGSTFSVPGVSITKPTSQPNVYGPPAFWVRGEFYTRTGSTALTYQSAVGNTITLGGNANAPTLAGTDASGTLLFSGAFAREPLGVFLVQDALGTATVPVLPANANDADNDGSLHLSWEAPPGDFPPAVMLPDGRIWVYVGTAAEDTNTANGTSAAYYIGAEVSDQSHEMLKLRTDGSGVVTCTDYASAESAVGTYSTTTHLFQTSPPQSTGEPPEYSFPVPVYGVDPNANFAFWGLTQPPGGLPATFVVRDEAWRLASYDAMTDTALYQGYYTGQTMSLGEAEEGTGQRLVTLSDPLNNDGDTTSGTLSGERRSVRLRDGTLVLSGDDQGDAVAVQYDDEYKLETISADLDIIGNNLSFGILEGDASLAGALFQFADVSAAASLHSILSRPQAQWGWWKAEGLDGDTLSPVMWLGADHRLNLYKAGSYDAPAIVLDPAGTSSFQGPVRVPQSGDIPMGIYQEGDPP